jgi:hypothetical protein
VMFTQAIPSLLYLMGVLLCVFLSPLGYSPTSAVIVTMPEETRLNPPFVLIAVSMTSSGHSIVLKVLKGENVVHYSWVVYYITI